MSKEHAYAYEAGYQDGLRAATDQLKAENAKLRELLSDMWTFTQLVDVCGRLSNGSAWSAAEFGKRMKELGVIE